MTGTNPKCQEITMEVTPSSINNNKSEQTEFVSIDDIKSMDPCDFTLNNKTNPITKKTCQEAFTNRHYYLKKSEKKRDLILNIYLMSISLLLFYLLIKLNQKS